MVNTFIPLNNYKNIAKVLDNKRLGKQRVEAKQILNILEGKQKTKGFINHPVVEMWRGYEDALKKYYNTIIDEWKKRGFINRMRKYPIKKNVKTPWFVRNRTINLSFQANLLNKDYDHYKLFFKEVPKSYRNYS